MTEIQRITILWEHITGYMQASLQALLHTPTVELLVVQRLPGENVDSAVLTHPRLQFLNLAQEPAAASQLPAKLTAFQPQLALLTGNGHPLYQQAAAQLRQQGSLVIWATDRILRDPLRDAYQTLHGRFGQWNAYHAAFVPGKQAARYAQRIGFPAAATFTGLYSADTTLFCPIGEARHSQTAPWPRAFLFVGQLIPRKGVDTLLTAYQQYRQQTAVPWPLLLAGAGPLHGTLTGQPGVQLLGALPPAQLAQIMAQSGCFILPSRWDHWGVVLHEAACAGLPILASTTCGATADLLEHGRNGFTFPPNQPAQLAALMQQISTSDNGRTLGAHSLHLSRQFSPQRFATTLLHTIPTALTR